MKTQRWILAVALICCFSRLPHASAQPGGGEGWAPAIAASREVATQVDSMQRAFATIPQAPGGRGLFAQTESIRVRLFEFRQTISQQQSRENVAIAFLALDGEVKNLLFDLKGLDNPAIILVSRRLGVAEADLQYAVIGPGANPTQKTEALVRQTLALAARAEEFERIVRFAFLEQASLAEWMGAVKNLREQIANFKSQQEKNVSADDLKAAVKQVDQAWEKIVDRLVAVPELTYILVQTDAIQLDTVLGRVDRLVGVENRKGRLPTKLLQQ
ncbi:MAG: hypothetical protein WCL32_09740 [Planctomycetota bacterium]